MIDDVRIRMTSVHWKFAFCRRSDQHPVLQSATNGTVFGSERVLLTRSESNANDSPITQNTGPETVDQTTPSPQVSDPAFADATVSRE